MIIQKHFFNLILKSISKFAKVSKIRKRKKLSQNHVFFVSLPSDSRQFQKQLMAKFGTRFGSKPLGNYSYKKIAQINRNLRKKKEVFLSLSNLHVFAKYKILLNKHVKSLNL